jgi:outer membrane protein insertion porin family
VTCNNIINKVKGLVKGIFALYLLAFLPGSVSAQNKIVNPDISYAGTPRQCEIGGITVKGVEDY